VPISVLTRSYDNARTGANSQETQLIATAVGKRGIRRRFDPIQLPGDRRRTEAQLLIAAAVQFPGNQHRDLLIAATMSNDVFAFDANTGHRVWQQNVGPSIQGTRDIDLHTVNDQWGVLSTPVIHDGVIYLCAWISDDHSVAKAHHKLFALHVIDGNKAQPDPVISRTRPTTPATAVMFNGSPPSRASNAPRCYSPTTPSLSPLVRSRSSTTTPAAGSLQSMSPAGTSLPPGPPPPRVWRGHLAGRRRPCLR
jgi:hypothetical protein